MINLANGLGTFKYPTRVRIWCQRFFQEEHGFVTAELALGLPAVLLVTYMCMWGIAVAALDLRLHSVTANVARILARGDTLNSEYLSRLPSGASVSTSRNLDRITVTITTQAPTLIGPLKFPILDLSASTVLRDETYVSP